jgi:hypothetical protein
MAASSQQPIPGRSLRCTNGFRSARKRAGEATGTASPSLSENWEREGLGMSEGDYGIHLSMFIEPILRII